MTHHIPPMACPFCGSPNDAMTSANLADDRPPDAGSLTLCLYCRNLAIIDGTPPTSLREPTRAELIDALADPSVQRVFAAMAQIP